ncbi:MAG: ABC transporter permease [Cyanobacteriota bacterium]|nr:ABC transporter permease [Cyanobacteriota bacterium]
MGLKIPDLFKLTYVSLRGNPLRSTLTALGVFMGVGAVSATLQVSNISQAIISQQLDEREAPQINVNPDWGPNYQPFEIEDLEYLKNRLSEAKAISTMRWAWFNPVLFQDRQAEPDMYGVSQDYFDTSGRALEEGRRFTPADFTNYRSVVAIDRILAEQLFGSERPIDRRIYVGGRPYVVVGVMESKLQYSDEEPRGMLVMPLSVHSALTGERTLRRIQIRPENLEDLEPLETRLLQLLEQRYPNRAFRTRHNVVDLLEQQKTLNSVGRALLAVGGIALLVGGVGIANITIASVMERTKEIGLRLAIGATARDILLQFVLEAMLLSLLGGTLAIATVHSLTVVVSQQFELPYKFDGKSATFALGSALLVGIGAGFFPALRASQLDPVTALRS